MASEQLNGSEASKQKTQYDKIGTKYNAIKLMPSVEPEEPSVVKALGSVKGKRCLGTSKGYYTNVHINTEARLVLDIRR